MNSDRRSAPNDGIEKQIISNEQIYDLFIARVAQESATIIENQNARIRNRLALYLTIGIALVAGILALALEEMRSSVRLDARNEAQSIIDRELGALLGSQDLQNTISMIVSDEVGEVDTRIGYVQDQILFLNAVREFEAEDEGFTNAQAEALIQGIKRAVEQGDQVVALSQIIDSIVPNFAAADRFDLIEEMDSIVTEEMQTSVTVCQAVSISVGISISSFPVAPENLAGRFLSEWTTLTDLFRRYAEACRRLNYPEVPYFFDLLLTHMEGGGNDIANAIASETATMDVSELGTIARLGSSLLSGAWANSGVSAAAIERSKARAVQTVDAYQNFDPTGTLSSLK